MHDIRVDLGERAYTIHIKLGALKDIGNLVAGATRAVKLLLVSNPTVFPLYGKQVVKSLEARGFEVKTCLLPDGERYKNLHEASLIIDQALEWDLDRSGAVLALGGGVVGDLAGFVAAIIHRGIDFIQIPTSLLAQVDSSVGGKVAVNHPRGKNLLGAFHQPKLVVIDPSTLLTLEDAEFDSGIGEVVKYGIAYDRSFFAFLEASSEQIKRREWDCIQKMIAESCRIKTAIVEQDEHEKSLRMILNLGHTFGHALELLGEYKLFRHGEAVVMGTVAAGFMAVELGLMSLPDLDRIKALYRSLGLTTKFPDYKPEDVYEGMKNDKKITRNHLRFVVPAGIGSFKIIEDPPVDLIHRAVVRAQEQ